MNDLSGTLNEVATNIGFGQAGKNKVINGNFGIWQRGTSFSTVGYGGRYADRFLGGTNGSVVTRTVSQQTFTPGAAPVAGYEGQYFLRVDQSVAGTAATFNVLDTQIEDVRTFAGQTVTFSVWLKADAARTVTGTISQLFGSGGSGTVDTSLGSFSVTTAWTRFSATITIPSITGKTLGSGNHLVIRLGLPLNTIMTIDTWGWQLEYGSKATPFQTATGTIQGELAACQRYYYRTTPNSGYSRFGLGQCTGTTAALGIIPFPVQMRVAPSALEQTGTASNYAVTNTTQGVVACSSVPTFDGASVTVASVTFTVASGIAAGNVTQLLPNNNTTAYLGWSAEL
jgi:hypothetical protein